MSDDFDTTRDSDGSPEPIGPKPEPPPADPDPTSHPGDGEKGEQKL